MFEILSGLISSCVKNMFVRGIFLVSGSVKVNDEDTAERNSSFLEFLGIPTMTIRRDAGSAVFGASGSDPAPWTCI